MDINVGSSTPKSSTRSGPLTDLTNVSATELEKRHASAMVNNSEGATPKSSTRSGPLAIITNVSAAELNNKRVVALDNSAEGSTPKSSTISGNLADITNVSAAELKNKRARHIYALLTVDQKKDIVQRNCENRRQKNEVSMSKKYPASMAVVGNESMPPVMRASQDALATPCIASMLSRRAT